MVFFVSLNSLGSAGYAFRVCHVCLCHPTLQVDHLIITSVFGTIDPIFRSGPRKSWSSARGDEAVAPIECALYYVLCISHVKDTQQLSHNYSHIKKMLTVLQAHTRICTYIHKCKYIYKLCIMYDKKYSARHTGVC